MISTTAFVMIKLLRLWPMKIMGRCGICPEVGKVRIICFDNRPWSQIGLLMWPGILVSSSYRSALVNLACLCKEV